MLSIPDAFPIDLPPLQSDLSMPHTLTPGRGIPGGSQGERSGIRPLMATFHTPGLDEFGIGSGIREIADSGKLLFW